MTSADIIKRRAIDPSVSLGSFYDMRRDCLLKQQNITIQLPEDHQLHNEIRCELIDGNTKRSENLLKMIDIDDDLRLSILLSKKRTAVAKLADHPDPIDKYTRFLYMYYADREKKLPENMKEAKKIIPSIVREADATHIIQAISFGIDVVVVLQLPSKDNIGAKIDAALEKIRTRLDGSTDFPTFTADDENVLEKIIETKVYSNVPELTKMKSLRQICQYISESKKKSDTYRALAYTLKPIEWLCSDGNKPYISYIPLESRDSDDVEEHLLKLLKTINRLRYWFSISVIPVHFQHHQEERVELERQWQCLEEEYENVIQGLRELVFNIRSDQQSASEINKILKHKDQTTLTENIRGLISRVSELSERSKQINSSKGQPQTDRNDDRQTKYEKLFTDEEPTRTIAPSEVLMKNKQTTLSPEQGKEPKRNSQNPSSETKTSDKTSPVPTNEIINILLLGESGVGKSTFINAFVNYLKFETFKEAESSTPVVLIPVSFLITTGNNFEECTVKFGDSDSLNNEDFDCPGQSVTQHCKSYLFDIDRKKGLKFRIIPMCSITVKLRRSYAVATITL